MLETDYLIVGSGAVGMAFADIILEESNHSMIIVDRYQKPGGHWNLAYPFVTLHQPSAFYGVSSVELSRGLKDEVGLNKGMHDLASGAEVSAYYDHVMRHRFLPSGQVQYFPLCNYKGDNKFESILTNKNFEVKVNKKVIDATHLKTSVPSSHTPNFEIAQGVQFMPLNDLVKISKPPAGFVIIGGGKTGIDACLWLLEQGVNPDHITWILSRDAWLLDRLNTQPTLEFFHNTMGAQVAQFEAAAAATSISDLFIRLEEKGVLLRLDKNVTPSMFHGATVSKLELEELRKIKNIIRKGRVSKIGLAEIHLDKGSIETSIDHIHIDCSATAIANISMKDIFEDGMITPQTVRSYQPVFSAALIAHVELAYDTDNKKNELCQVVPLPNHDTDWIRMMVTFMTNQYNWGQDKELRHWLRNNRLDGFGKMVSSISKDDTDKQAVLKKMKEVVFPAVMNLQKLQAEI